MSSLIQCAPLLLQKLFGLLLFALSLYAPPLAAQEHILRWGADATSNVPYSFHDLQNPQKITGFEYELINALAQQEDLKAQFIQNDWDGLIPGLSRHLYDLVICGIEITPAHEQVVDFSDPYYIADERLVTRNGPKAPKTWQDLHNRRIGTIKNTQAEDFLRRDPTIKIYSYDEESLIFSDLLHGRIDGVFIDNPIALYYSQADPSFVIRPLSLGKIAYGIAFPKGENRVLRQHINDALRHMQQDGQYQNLLSRWNLLNEATRQQFGITTSQLPFPSAFNHYVQQQNNIHTPLNKLRDYLNLLPLVGKAALMTLIISVFAMLLAMTLGLFLALLRREGPRILSGATGCFIEILRGTPLLIQILFIFYGLPQFGINLSPFTAGVLSLGLNYAAFEAENYRAGLQAIPRGQLEAALALNMTRMQALRYVIVPQALKTVIPVIINDFISLLKDSSLVSMITLTELTQTYIRLSSAYFDYLGIGLIIGATYLLLGLPFIQLGRYVEKKLASSNKKTASKSF